MLSPLEVIEAAYRQAGTDLDWLRGIGKAVRPLLDGERGLLAYLIDPAVAPAEQFARRVVFDVSPEDVEFAEELMSRNARMMATFHDARDSLDPSAVGAYRRAGLGEVDDKAWMRDAYDRLGVSDYAAFGTIEPDGKRVVFVAGQREVRAYDRLTIQLWAKVAAHIAAGRRLRATVGTNIEVVLSTDGRIEHAVGQGTSRLAREVLRDAVVRQEHARSFAARKEPERAIEEWTALVGGRWSLIEQFERSGRRYLVARPNELGLTEPTTLTPRERTLGHLAALGKSNPLIAYELGIEEATVKTHLAAVMKKLGATSRIELIRRLR